MGSLFRTTCVALLVLSLSLSTGANGLPPAIESLGRDAVEIERIANAARLFAEQGLQLPPVSVLFFSTLPPCNGNAGLFTADDSEIRVCSEKPQVLLHELAHAWINANVDESGRQQYLHVQGLEAWNDPEIKWRRRGTEHAANTISRTLEQHGGIEGSAFWTRRLMAYEVLTGQPYVRPMPPVRAPRCRTRPGRGSCALRVGG